MKALVGGLIATKTVRTALRWFMQQGTIPSGWRELAHRKIAKRAHFGDKTFEYETPSGVRLMFLHAGTANELYWHQDYEPETTGVFLKLCRSAEVILDIGAAEGVYSLLGAAANQSATIVAFEPGDVAARLCARNIELNQPLSRKVLLQTCALSDHSGTSTLYVAGTTGGTSSLNPNFRTHSKPQSVEIRTGSEVLETLGLTKVSLIKLDTESTEPAVLRGLQERLERDRPDIICEVLRGRTERELEAILAPLGYRFLALTLRGVVARASIEGDPTYRAPNFLFTVRTDRDLAAIGIHVR